MDEFAAKYYGRKNRKNAHRRDFPRYAASPGRLVNSGEKKKTRRKSGSCDWRNRVDPRRRCAKRGAPWSSRFVLGLRDYIPPRHKYFSSRYSSIPYFEPSRPIPDSFTPPNGAVSVEIIPVFTPTIPYSRASATRHTRVISRP
jgi:hypothetical protein